MQCSRGLPKSAFVRQRPDVSTEGWKPVATVPGHHDEILVPIHLWGDVGDIRSCETQARPVDHPDLDREHHSLFERRLLLFGDHGGLLGVQANAHFILDVAKEHGSFGKFISRWPSEDLIGLFTYMKQRGARLGGMTGQRVLRNMGKDTFVITGDVARCLQRAGLDITENPTTKRELSLIQDTFNRWHDESGQPYSHISRISACSA